MATIMRPTTPQAAPETKVFGLLFSLEKKTYEMSYLNWQKERSSSKFDS